MIPSPATAHSIADDGKPIARTLGPVLVVDDDPVARAMLRHVCEGVGAVSVIEAVDGLDALDAVRRQLPDLIILDIMMPRLDGLETCRRLRRSEATAQIPILIQTGLTAPGVGAECFAVGATDVVSKPVNYAETQARVRVHLENRLLMRSLEAFQRRIGVHLALADKLARNLLPSPADLREIEARHGLLVEAHSRPAEEVGGDFWRVRARPEGGVAVFLVDAVGHGVAAAINAFRVDAVLNGLRHAEAAGYLRELDERLLAIDDGQLTAAVTAVTYDPDRGSAVVCTAGAPQALHCRGRHIELVCSGGLPVGTGLLTPRPASIDFAPGDSLLLYSDGWAGGDPTEALRRLSIAVQHDPSPSLPTIAADADGGDDLTLVRLTRRN